MCCMIEIPRITPVRIKTEEISESLINPDSRGYNFPNEVGPRVVYLDKRYEYPEQTLRRATDYQQAQAERERQGKIWEQCRRDGCTMFLDRQVEEREPGNMHRIAELKMAAYDELGTRNTAAFYERVFSQFFKERMSIVVISTGVKLHDGNNYHEIGYLKES